MKKLIYFFIAGIVLLSCQNSNKYTINGTVANDVYEGTSVFLQQMTDNAMEVVDTVVVQNRKFSFSGTADTPLLRFIVLDGTLNPRQESRIPVLIEPGKLDVVFDSIVTVKGTNTNDAYTNFRLQQSDQEKKSREIISLFNQESAAGTMTEERDAELQQSYEDINKQLDNLSLNFVKENIGNKLGEFVFQSSSAMFTPEQQKEILDLASEEFKSTKRIQRVIKRLENLEKVAVGQKFVDFTLKDTEGTEVSLSDYAGKGNYVLVDFWAAWCGPCLQEMPNVVAAYEKYKSKGFEVVGVSLDQEHDRWVEGIKDLNMTWPQMSDLQFWDSPIVDLYAIRGIPHTILLDKDGTILEKDLRGEALELKLAELMP